MKPAPSFPMFAAFLVVVAFLIPLLLCGAAFGMPSKGEPPVRGERVYYYNGDMRVLLTLSFEEIAIEPARPEGLTRRDVAGMLPGATVREEGPHGELRVVFREPVRDRIGLTVAAKAVRAKRHLPQAVLYGPGTGARRSDRWRHVLEPRLAVRVNKGVSIDEFSVRHRLTVEEEVWYSPDTYILRAEDADPLAALDTANELYESGTVVFATPLFRRPMAPRFVPNDPRYGDQWHLNNTGQAGGTSGEDIRAERAWDIVTGAGVNIVVNDDGVDIAHEDLLQNVRADLCYDYVDFDTDPTPASGDNHGTRCAGIAAARGDNGIGVAGVAFQSGLVGVRLLGRATDRWIADAMTRLAEAPDPADIAHVNSNSWGPEDDGQRLETFGPLTAAALAEAVTEGRGGLGSILVWAAGNGRGADDNANYDGFASSRYTIAVAASGQDGVFASYSEPGASILVNAPSRGGGAGITTTDVGDGYHTNFGGTSASTPMVAGVAALVLEANPALSWRDVQHILVNTSTKNDPDNPSWLMNGAGHLFSPDYGFGRVNAHAAVDAALAWSPVAPSSVPLSAQDYPALPIPDNTANGVVRTVQLDSAPVFRTEHVEVLADISHPSRGDLEITLTSPAGTVSVLAEPRGDTNPDYSNWLFTSVAHWDEDPRGDWTLTVSDLKSGDTGTLNSWAITVHGADGAELGVSPAAPFASAGPAGGDFTPTGRAYTLSNLSGAPLDWSAATDAAWLDITPDSGTIAPGLSTEMTVSLSTVAASLEPGSYEDTVTLTDHTVGDSSVLPAYLSVEEPLVLAPDTPFMPIGEAGGPFTWDTAVYTVTNNSATLSAPWSAGFDTEYFEVTPLSGTLAPGESEDLIVSLAHSVSALWPNTYPDTFRVTNAGTDSETVVPARLTVAVHWFALDTDPGWAMDPGWEFGAPMGGGTGGPTSAHTGQNVYAYNLSGNYTDNMPARALTTPPFNLRNYRDVGLVFHRWLHVEEGIWDEATVHVSTDGTTWETVWANPPYAPVVDMEWVRQDISLAAIADGEETVYVRWVMGPTDSSVVYAGWYIDDIAIHGEALDHEPPGEPVPLHSAAGIAAMLAVALLFRRRSRRVT